MLKRAEHFVIIVRYSSIVEGGWMVRLEFGDNRVAIRGRWRYGVHYISQKYIQRNLGNKSKVYL